MTVDVGGRLRYVRERYNLSQRELAKRSGVPNSTISLIEANKVNPSIGALKRILDGVPIGLAEFFAIEPDKPRKIFYQAEETEIGKGGISIGRWARPGGTGVADLERALRAGSDTGRVPLVHEGGRRIIISAG